MTEATTDTVPLWDPKRSDIVDVPRNVADNLVRTGYHYKTGDDALREQTDQGGLGKANAIAHSWANSFTFGGADLAVAHLPSMLGGDYLREGLKRTHHQEQIHGNAATFGDVAGYFGPGGLAHILGKGAEKAGMHALLKAAAEHTPQHLLEKLGAETAAKHTLGEAAQRLAGKAGSAVGFGLEQGTRGAAQADVDQTLYDKKYDVEKVAQAFGYDALTGAATDATFGLAGEGLRGLRKGLSKTADKLENVYPSTTRKTGRIQIEDKIEPTVYMKKTQTVVEKKKTTTKTGGGWEKGETHAKVKTHDSEFEETKAKAENEIDDRYDKQTTTKEKAKPGRTVQYKENIYDDERPETQTSGYEWGHNAKPHEVLAAIRTELDKQLAHDPTDLAYSRKVFEHEADYLQAKAEDRHGDAHRLKTEKGEIQDYLKTKYPEYGPLLDEYGKVSRGEHKVFDPAKENVAPVRKKVGVKTTTEVSGQEPEVVTKEKTKNDNYHHDLDQTTTRRQSVKDALDETKTRFHHDLDSEHEVKETTVRNHKFEPITLMKPKKQYVNQYETHYKSKLPWQVHRSMVWGAAAAGAAGVPFVAGAVAPLIAADTITPYLLNNRKESAALLDRITQPVAKSLGTLTRNLTQSKLNSDWSDPGKLSRHLRDPDKLYNQVTSSLQAHANDPAATQQAVQHQWQHVLSAHPQLQTGLIVHTQNVARAAQAHIPPDNRPPTAQHTPYNPPRSQKVKFLRLFHAMNQPLAALENPTPQMINVIEQTNPETLNLLRRSLAGHIAEGKKPFKGKAAMVASMIMGEPINPRNVAAYLKRLQTTASLDAPATEPSGGNHAGPHAGSIAGPKSAKVQQDAATLYATPQQLQQLA